MLRKAEDSKCFQYDTFQDERPVKKSANKFVHVFIPNLKEPKSDLNKSLGKSAAWQQQPKLNSNHLQPEKTKSKN